jgi:hypothetical protein
MSVEGDLAPAISVADDLQRSQHRSGMVEMAMRKNDCFNRSEVDAQPRDILFKGAILGTAVEQKGPRLVTLANSDQAGKAVRGAAEAGAAKDPGTAPFPPQAGKLGLDESGNRGEIVGCVINQDEYVDAVDEPEVGDGPEVGHGFLQKPPPALLPIRSQQETRQIKRGSGR